ncbi:HAD family hydrolase, partial [bacterium]
IPESIQLLNTIRDQGVQVVLLSGTPRPLAEPLISHLGLTEAICAEPIIEHHYYTGGLIQPHPRGLYKVRYIDDWLSSHQRDWEGSIAMADHWHDRHLLSKVSIPITVHPKKNLRKLALQKDWLILSNPSDLDHVTQRVIENIK